MDCLVFNSAIQIDFLRITCSPPLRNIKVLSHIYGQCHTFSFIRVFSTDLCISQTTKLQDGKSIRAKCIGSQHNSQCTTILTAQVTQFNLCTIQHQPYERLGSLKESQKCYKSATQKHGKVRMSIQARHQIKGLMIGRQVHLRFKQSSTTLE